MPHSIGPITKWVTVIFAVALGLTLANKDLHAQNSSQSLQSKTEIENIVRDYLLENPEIIIEALEVFEQRRIDEQRLRQQQLISQNSGVLLASEHQTILGNPDGDITLIEFFDYNCGFCRDSLQHVERLVEEDKNLRVILKEFPVLGPGSQQAARVAIAASKVDPTKYLMLHSRLLNSRGQTNERTALRAAEKVGLDVSKIRELMNEPIIEEAITEVYSIATVLGVNGTPTFIVGNEVLPGAVGYEVLRQKLDAMRECGDTSCS